VQELLRYTRTAKGISVEQLFYRILRRVQGDPVPRDPGVAIAPSFVPGLRRTLLDTPPPEPWDGSAIADAAIRGVWDLAGQPFLVVPQLDWSLRHGNPLQSFHLQYHEPLRALARVVARTGDRAAADAIVSVVTRWIESTRRGGGDAWHPYTISVRVLVWLDVLALAGDVLPAAVRESMSRSLAMQLDVLSRRRELQIGANHLQRNHAALAIGGLAFVGTRAAHWRDTGLSGTWSALDRHVLRDGMHYERSPMYHAGMLSDVLRVLECCEFSGVSLPERVASRTSEMAHALLCLTRADGSLHQFNDTAAGVAAPTSWLVERTARLTHGSRDMIPAYDGVWTLRESGYAGWRDRDAGTSLVFDAGEAGPREQPGHAHCDALSFELCLGGVPVVVNAGVHGYDHDPFRAFSRSTRAHNTVQIGEHEQHEMWATFRVARFGTVAGPDVGAAQPFTVGGLVHGYAGGLHARTITQVGPRELRITDTMSGVDGELASARLILHPDFLVEGDESGVVARRGSLTVRIRSGPLHSLRIACGELNPADGWHFPTFGVARQASCLIVQVQLPAPPLVTSLSWGWS
jgi:uncharacterized heparinase superfamily protein